ncbi:MAG: hypothetical protein GXP25_25325 [Planctomycetes bacterium]|nr:hypothetical protein [Planctomycetota bacterium]
MAKKKAEEKRTLTCPLCMMMEAMGDCVDRHEGFVKHMRNARIEFLEGIRSVIDAHIDDLKGKGKSGSGFKKVEVTD